MRWEPLPEQSDLWRGSFRWNWVQLQLSGNGPSGSPLWTGDRKLWGDRLSKWRPVFSTAWRLFVSMSQWLHRNAMWAFFTSGKTLFKIWWHFPQNIVSYISFNFSFFSPQSSSSSNPCLSSPCQNNGTCAYSANTNTLTCLCEDEFSGPHCEIDLCARLNCPSNSMCIRGESCQCLAGFQGMWFLSLTLTQVGNNATYLSATWIHACKRDRLERERMCYLDVQLLVLILQTLQYVFVTFLE